MQGACSTALFVSQNAGHKRKGSSSPGRWNFPPKQKPRKLENVHYDGNASGSRQSSAGSRGAQKHEKQKVKARLQRGSSLFRSFFSISGGHNKAIAKCSEEKQNPPDPVPQTPSPESSNETSASNTVIRSTKLDLAPDTGGDHAPLSKRGTEWLKDSLLENDTSLFGAGMIRVDNQSSQIAQNQSQIHHKSHQSQSIPGVVHRLSHRLSSTFGHPTVVHRTSVRSRPSVHSLSMGPGQYLPTGEGGKAGATSDLSTINSTSGSSPAPLSTNPTSDGLTISHSKSRGHPPNSIDGNKILTIINQDVPENRLEPIPEGLSAKLPSIVTVEAAASAKIFFETHFNVVLSGTRPRSIRRTQLDERLTILNASFEARQIAYSVWIQQESQDLRQERVLKSRTNGAKSCKGISIAGYEVVQVLGRGSFGVVRLVREKLPPEADTFTSRANSRSNSKESSRPELNHVRAYAKVARPLFSSRRRSPPKLRKEVYAMKVIRKSDMLRSGQEGHLRAERDFLVGSEGSRWIIPLVASFQDNKNLYLIMDYCIGGDFLGLLIRKNTLSEEHTKFYIAEMILCVEEAHKLNWIHRDVKPDNFLIAADGHLKISDFGLAFDGHWAHDQSYYHRHRHSLIEKLGITIDGDEQDKEDEMNSRDVRKLGNAVTGTSGSSPRKTRKDVNKFVDGPGDGDYILQWRDRHQKRKLARSVVGTSQYMAPEVIRGEPYDGRCDWWSIGIILYECLYGFTPFACDSRQNTKLKILAHKKSLVFPDLRDGQQRVSDAALDLMERLLQEREKRLSSRKYELNDFAKHMASFSTRRLTERMCREYTSQFVFSDDADDIKKHYFFHGVPWNNLHLAMPPFVPRVKDKDDTKYFDEDPISDHATDSSEEEQDHRDEKASNGSHLNSGVGVMADSRKVVEHHHENQKIDHSRKVQGKLIDQFSPQQQRQMTDFTRADLQRHVTWEDAVALHMARAPSMKKSKKEKKRPRDKILRDEHCGKKALEMRKKLAFLGYGYRRPKGVEAVVARLTVQGLIGRVLTATVTEEERPGVVEVWSER